MAAHIKKGMVVNDEILKKLCQEYLFEIGLGIYECLPYVKVRYVIGENKFAYAYFGNFFFFGDDFYVWDTDEKWEDVHNQDVVEAVFEDECQGRGYAHRELFAGVETKFVDSNGEHIFTGDVIKLERSNDYIQYFAVGGLTYKDDCGYYCFILDNHCLPLDECVSRNYKMTRVGTVFYQLDWSEFTGVNERTMQFNGWRDTEEDRKLKVQMAKFTPSFEKENWKYVALDVLEVEYDWRK